MVKYGEILMKWFTAISVLIYPTLLVFHPCYVLDGERPEKRRKWENDIKTPSQRWSYPTPLKEHALDCHCLRTFDPMPYIEVIGGVSSSNTLRAQIEVALKILVASETPKAIFGIRILLWRHLQGLYLTLKNT